jgi:hypothetical protein
MITADARSRAVAVAAAVAAATAAGRRPVGASQRPVPTGLWLDGDDDADPSSSDTEPSDEDERVTSSEEEDEDEDGAPLFGRGSVVMTLQSSLKHVNIPFLLPPLETNVERIARSSQPPEVSEARLRPDLVCRLSYSRAYAWVRSAYVCSSILYSWDHSLYDARGNLQLTVPTRILCDLFRNLVRGMRALSWLHKLKRHLGLIKLTHHVCVTLRENALHGGAPGSSDRQNWLEENDIVAAAIGTLRRVATYSTAADRLAVRWDEPEDTVAAVDDAVSVVTTASSPRS